MTFDHDAIVLCRAKLSIQFTIMTAAKIRERSNFVDRSGGRLEAGGWRSWRHPRGESVVLALPTGSSRLPPARRRDGWFHPGRRLPPVPCSPHPGRLVAATCRSQGCSLRSQFLGFRKAENVPPLNRRAGRTIAGLRAERSLVALLSSGLSVSWSFPQVPSCRPRQDRQQLFAQRHGLPAAGRADQEDVVDAGRSDGESLLGPFLTLDVRDIERVARSPVRCTHCRTCINSHREVARICTKQSIR